MSFFVKVRAARRGAYLAFIGLEVTKGRKQLKVVRPLKCVMHDQCDDKPTVTFPAVDRHRPLVIAELYCLMMRYNGVNNLPTVVTQPRPHWEWNPPPLDLSQVQLAEPAAPPRQRFEPGSHYY